MLSGGAERGHTATAKSESRKRDPEIRTFVLVDDDNDQFYRACFH